MSQSLAVKYRPTEFTEVSSQGSIIKILNRQLELKKYSNVYAFSGPTGVGKTTLARIFASKINGEIGNPIKLMVHQIMVLIMFAVLYKVQKKEVLIQNIKYIL